MAAGPVLFRAEQAPGPAAEPEEFAVARALGAAVLAVSAAELYPTVAVPVVSAAELVSAAGADFAAGSYPGLIAPEASAAGSNPGAAAVLGAAVLAAAAESHRAVVGGREPAADFVPAPVGCPALGSGHARTPKLLPAAKQQICIS